MQEQQAELDKVAVFCANATALESDFATERARLTAATHAAESALADARSAAEAAQQESSARSEELARARAELVDARQECDNHKAALAGMAAEVQAATAARGAAEAEVGCCCFPMT